MNQLVTVEMGAVAEASQDPVTVYLAGLAPTGRRAMKSRLEAAVLLFQGKKPGSEKPSLDMPWHQLTFAHVSALRTRLQDTYESAATINMTLAAVRGVARAAFMVGRMSADEYQRIREVKPVKGESLPKGRALNRGEVEALLDTCEDTPAGRRDAALLALMYTAGLRRSEAVGLHRNAYDAETGELRVTGKGGKERLLYVVNGTAEAMADYLEVRGSEPGYLFLPSRKGGELVHRGMTSQAVYAMLQDRQKRAGVKACSPHDFRRSFITSLLEGDVDLGTVQKLAGHSNIATTARYDRRDEKAKRRAVETLHVGYRRRAAA